MPDIDVLVIGDYYCDIIITGLPDVPCLGADMYGQEMEMAVGGMFINTTALQRLGVRVGWVTDFGSDLFSQYALGEIRKEGLREEFFHFHTGPVRKMSLSFSFQQDRGFITYADPCPFPLPASEVRQYRPRAVLLAGAPVKPEVCDFIHVVHECGGIVILDTGYSQHTLDNSDLAQSLCLVDIFTINQSEAAALTGKASVEEALEQLAPLCPLVVIKCGAGGAVAQHGARRVYMPPLTVNVVDTTGAGDCFNSGFLAAYLRGLSLETCLQYGNICGGLSTTAHGGTAHAPTLAKVESLLKTAYPPPAVSPDTAEFRG
jgi:sugar/nucleoside kinase (ribokinase family)